MGLFEKVAVVDLKIQLSLLAGGLPFAAIVFAATVGIGEEWAFWASVVVGLLVWAVIGTVVYRRLPS